MNQPLSNATSVFLQKGAVEATWAPGFYRVEVDLAPYQPHCLRLVAGPDDKSGGQSQPLAPADKLGRVRSVVVLRQPCERLEVLSEVDGVAVRLDRLHLSPLNRMQALWHMMWNLRADGGRRRWRAVPGMVGMALVAAVRFNSRIAAGIVVQRYLHGLRSPGQRKVGSARLRLGSLLASSVELVPVHHLHAETLADGGIVWVATGGDPHFELSNEGASCRLPAGWYRLRVRLGALEGRIAAPCLYPDFARGAKQEDVISLPELDAEGWIRTLLMFSAPVTSLRFDPTIAESQFTLDGFELQRVGRCRAFASMLAAMCTSRGSIDWASVTRTCLEFARSARTAGLSAAAGSLYEKYLDLRSPHSYGEWVRRYDSHVPSLPEELEEAPGAPTFSILLPVYQTPERWLRSCLDSVLAQTYPHWELCVVDDASPDERVREVLREYERLDTRVRLCLRDENGHISEASNSALLMAQNAFIGLLDHDDELRPHALAEMARAIVLQPQAQLLYSDEDKIDEHGRRFQPNFKPDWNPDLLRSQNYVCHFSVIRTELVRAVGGFRRGFEGSQDHDLILRCIERVGDSEVVHVPKILYHWRAIEGSTALAREAKDYASEAGLRAVAEHLQRVGNNARVELLPHGHYRVRWPLPEPAPLVSLIIPTRDRVALLRSCVESVLDRTRYPNFEILVVDNQSGEQATLSYLEELRRHPSVRVLRYDAAFNYSAINNWAVAQAKGTLVGLLNNDIEVISGDWLEEMAGHAMRPDVGAVGAMLYYPDGTIQHAGVVLGLGGVANHIYSGQLRGYAGHAARALVAQNLSSVTGACMLLRRQAFEQVGGLDESLKVAFNDVDLCLRLRKAGYRNVWTPFAELYHHESASRGRDDSSEKQDRFLGEVRFMEARWGDTLLRDPAYNPNLSLEGVNAAYAFPPRDS